MQIALGFYAYGSELLKKRILKYLRTSVILLGIAAYHSLTQTCDLKIIFPISMPAKISPGNVKPKEIIFQLCVSHVRRRTCDVSDIY